jgi:hypothetical protein
LPQTRRVESDRDFYVDPLFVMILFKYLSNKAMRKVEELRDRLKRHDLEVEEVGKVFRVAAA